MAAHSYSIYSVVGALAEGGFLTFDRVSAWAETFAAGFEQMPDRAENAHVADHLRNFAANLNKLRTIPDGAGRA